MFRVGLLLIIRRYFSVYIAVFMFHAFMLAAQSANICYVSTDDSSFFLYMYNIYTYVKEAFTYTQNKKTIAAQDSVN